MTLIPKLMYRARDAQGNMGILFVLVNKQGPDAKVLFRPDSDDLSPREEYVPDFLCWGRASMLKDGITVHYDRKIPIEEGTTEVRVVRASPLAGPYMRPARVPCE
jgi:hypothetical protein